MDHKIEILKRWIEESDNIVAFVGAGCSTESGIPDFRSTDGLYHQQYDYPPETILSHSFFCARPEEFYRFYRDKMLCTDAMPNAAHLKFAQLSERGSCARSSRRISMDCIRKRAAGMFWSCTEVSCVIIAASAGNFTAWKQCRKAAACRTVIAAV